MDNDLLQTDARNGSRMPIASVTLYWIPLGSGQSVVRVSGKVFEAVSALVQRRRPCDLYHSALAVIVPEGRFVIEMAPIPDPHGERRGVVAEGSVGAKWAGRFRLFRYEIRRWPAGVIPDQGEATSTVTVDVDPASAQRLLALVPSVPTPVWGRDELHAGEMWNSNSVTSWLLVHSGVDAAQIEPPSGGRAAGWSAGRVVAAREPVRAENWQGRSRQAGPSASRYAHRDVGRARGLRRRTRSGRQRAPESGRPGRCSPNRPRTARADCVGLPLVDWAAPVVSDAVDRRHQLADSGRVEPSVQQLHIDPLVNAHHRRPNVATDGPHRRRHRHAGCPCGLLVSARRPQSHPDQGRRTVPLPPTASAMCRSATLGRAHRARPGPRSPHRTPARNKQRPAQRR